MDKPTLPKDVFPSAGEDASASKKVPETPQAKSPSYTLAFTDDDFMFRDELLPVRVQLELLKPQVLQEEHNINSTVVVFGSARIWDQEEAEQKLKEIEDLVAAEPENPVFKKALKRAKRALDNVKYYEAARELARLITQEAQNEEDCDLFVVTGGGPGVMEAANRGAADAGGKSIGLNIVIPFEQKPNKYITPELSFQFHYFAIRKMHFLMRAKAMVALPGGFGTLDELFETLTLIQTKKIKAIPIVLLGSDYWNKVVDFNLLVEEGMIDEGDLSLFRIVDTADEAWQVIKKYWNL
jgi:uncharacterized protein (TIGR00730 family)